MNRPKEQGVEFIERLKHVITPEEFIQTEREKECDDKFCVVRISKKGRLIGKLNGNLFYVLAVDTKFDLYDH
ncbi:hypothetical protein G6R30_02490 [Fructobacillus sp. S1-1]|uniref:Uncharacterized protein n=1 Tax=Fructobacillus parabroussonetiae TaxID=2713174 RepID=A0ABS5QVV2_9LACO|nr:hypothetical protein [Fructobacillus parabroussonetiae]